MPSSQNLARESPSGNEVSVGKSWLLLRSGPGTAAYNMALDEALLECPSYLGTAVLRFYAWTEPAASFGYFQRFSEIEKLTLLRPLVRRPTGGGLVPHDADWTYSLAFSVTHEWYDLPAIESYRRVHQWICAAFRDLGIVTELAPDCRKSKPGQCFAGYEKSDVLWHGKKIAGAAQRRTRNGLLIQGSVQPPLSILRENWEQKMCAVAQSALFVNWVEMQLDEPVHQRALQAADRKYSQAAYNRRR